MPGNRSFSSNRTYNRTYNRNYNRNQHRNHNPNRNGDRKRNHTDTSHVFCEHSTTAITSTTNCRDCSRHLVWNPCTNYWTCPCGSYKSYDKPACEICDLQYNFKVRLMGCVKCGEFFNLA
jgi:hypothetical protein